VLTDEEYEILIQCARALDECSKQDAKAQNATDGAKASPPSTPSSRDGQERPGDWFNRNVRWNQILVPHGWVHVSTEGGVAHLRRPGKEGQGISATVGHCKDQQGNPALHVFSSNADPFEEGNTYSKFSAYTLLYGSPAPLVGEVQAA